MPTKFHFAMIPAIHYFSRNFPMRVTWAVAVCAASLCTNQSALFAATNRLPTQGSEDRYLLIVDTSAAMERNAENTQRAVNQLLSTGMVGQARPGDTIGLWTFSEDLHTGVFPLQRWTPQTRQKIATAATEFMAKVRYEKQPRFEKVVEPLTSVVSASERITVIILTDGTGKISGTPFDDQINESYRLNYGVQRKQRMPFMTVLRAKEGEFVGWRVNTPPFRPEFPAFPVEPKTTEPPVEMTEKRPEVKPEPKTEPTPATTPSLIVVGDPPAPASSTTTQVASAETNVPTATQTSAAPDSAAQPKPEVPPTPRAETPASQPAATVATPVVVKPVEPPKPEIQTTVTSTPAAIASGPSTESPPPKKESPPPAESQPAGSTAVTSQESPASGPPAEAATVQTAVATPSESLFNRTNLLIAGAVLLAVAFSLIYVLMRRAARPAEKVSLITRSMDRDQ